MNKLILTACLMVSAFFASFGAVQFNELDDGMMTFTFVTAGYYEISTLESLGCPVDEFGYYMVESATDSTPTGKAGKAGGGGGSAGGSGGEGDSEEPVGSLGYFNAGDTIGLWFKSGNSIATTSYNSAGFAAVETALGYDEGTIAFTVTPFETGPDQFSVSPFGTYEFNSQDDFGQSFAGAASGQPLPGVIAALAIGGTIFISRKLKIQIKK